MSLSEFLHSHECIRKATEYDVEKGRASFRELALGYLSEHKDYYALIENNLKYFGLPCDTRAVETAVKHIGYHYHEKFVSFAKEPAFYPPFHERIAKPNAVIDELLRNQRQKRPTLILSAHFGAMALIPGVLNACKLDLSSIIRFPSERIKRLIVSKGTHIVETLGYGRTTFFEVDKQPMLELVYGLEDGETYFSVLDEHTPFSVEVTFLGRTIGGGAGINKIIDIVGRDEMHVYFTAMVRGEDGYALHVDRIDLSNSDYIQRMFDIHEGYVRAHPEQWFFLQEVHENIPENG